MAYVFCCGGDCGRIGTSGGEHWVSGTNATFTNSISNSGGYSIRINPTAAIGVITRYAGTSAATWVIRFYVRFATLPSISMAILSVNGTGLYFNQSDSSLYTGSSTASLGATGVAVTTNIWYRVDFRTNMSANPWLTDAQINGTACGQHSNAVAASTGADFRFCGSSSTYDIYFDDIVASNTSGDYPIGAGAVYPFVPTSDGTHSGLTTGDYTRTLTGTDILNTTTDAYLLIDDIPLETGSSVDWINMQAPVANSYVECKFGPAPGVPTPTTAPRMVGSIIAIHAAGTGNANAEYYISDNGSRGNIFGPGTFAGSTSVIYKRLELPTPPSGGSWVIGGAGNGDFNNLRIRFGATGTVDANPDVYFDSAMIEAEFALSRTPKPTSIGHPFII